MSNLKKTQTNLTKHPAQSVSNPAYISQAMNIYTEVLSTLICSSADLLINRGWTVGQYPCVCWEGHELWRIWSIWSCETWPNVANVGHRKSKCAANVHLCVCVWPSVLTRLLESDKKSNRTRLEYEYRAGEREGSRKEWGGQEGKKWRRMRSWERNT